MPKHNWGLAFLLTLALVSHYVVPYTAATAFSNLPQTELLVSSCYRAAANSYSTKIAALIASRLAEYRINDSGYGDFGIYIEEIASGFTYGHDAYRTEFSQQAGVGYFHPASIAKLLIAYVFYYLDDLGEVDIWQVHTDPVVGQRQQWQPLIHRMLTHSVNLHHNIMLRYLGADLATQTLYELGLERSRLSRELSPAPGTTPAASWQRYGSLAAPRTTPADLGKLLASLARGNILSPQNNELFLNALTNTIYNSRIPQALNFQVPIAHKTGTTTMVYNDAALVLLPGNEFVLVLLTSGAPSRIQVAMRAIASDVFELHKARISDGSLSQALHLQQWLSTGPSLKAKKSQQD